MTKSRPTKLPLLMNTNIESEAELCSNILLYQKVIGSLNHIGQSTRPDIVLPVSRLSKYLIEPTIHQMHLALKLISYLMGTSNLSLKYSFDQSALTKVRCFSDAGSKFALVDETKHMNGMVIYADQQ